MHEGIGSPVLLDPGDLTCCGQLARVCLNTKLASAEGVGKVVGVVTGARFSL